MALKPRIHPADEPSIRAGFAQVVNMTAGEIARWLETDESRAVGFTRRGETESVGRQSGRRIIAILKTRQADLTESDYVQMRRTTGFIKRHLAQRPAGDVSRSRWRYSLMNWGCDPLKGGG
jgi:hypothetical protein